MKKITYFENKTVKKVNSEKAIDRAVDSTNKDSNGNKINISSEEVVDISNNNKKISNDRNEDLEIGSTKSSNGENVLANQSDTINDLENDVLIESMSPSNIRINTNEKKGESSDHNVETEVENFTNNDMECNGIKNKHDDDENRRNCIKNTVNNAIDTNEGECMINKQIATDNKDNNDEKNSSNDVQHNSNDTHCTNDSPNKTPDDNSIDDNPNDEESDSDSDYEPNLENESTPNKKMKFKTYQCYICFKVCCKISVCYFFFTPVA